jgi:hypothetical protein
VMTTVTLYTQSLEHIETLDSEDFVFNYEHVQSGGHITAIKATTNFPSSIAPLQYAQNLVVRVQTTFGKRVIDEVCRIDRHQLSWYPSLQVDGGAGRGTCQLDLTPLHKDAQQIVKAVLDKRERDKRANTIDLELACSQAMSNYLDTLKAMRERDTLKPYQWY